MNIKKSKIVLALVGSLLASSSVLADTATTTFGVTANIIGTCSLTADDLNFGNVDLSIGATSSTDIRITCPIGVEGYVRLNGGLHFDGTFRNVYKELNGTPYTVNYKLYTDSGMTVEFSPNSTPGNGGVSYSGVGEPVAVPVYGQIPIQSSQPLGLYQDTVEVTLDY